ncbi:MAG: hypothetical protein AUH39_03500 [Chloroflexi bacterium 13_1_40CM_67_9]|nr:MAG: hypothetical protein AUH39_03500 [Chloroflexi bacterium 13_1_40CM_67_9]
MDVDESRVAPGLVTPDPDQKVIAREDARRLSREGPQQLELRRRQRHLLVSSDRLHAGEIDDEATKAQLPILRVVAVHAVAAEQCLDPRGKFVVVEGFPEIVVSPDAQADHAIRGVVLRRQEENGDIRVAAELQAEADPVDCGHEHVQRHQVRMEVVERVHRLAGVGDRLYLVSGLFEDGAN